MKNVPNKIYISKTGFQNYKYPRYSTEKLISDDIEFILSTPAIKAAVDEHQRQISEEGYDAKHDDEHVRGELALAASHYARPHGYREMEITIVGVELEQREDYPDLWPWSPEDWKPTPDDRKREITKAMALLIAEYNRLDRKEAKS